VLVVTLAYQSNQLLVQQQQTHDHPIQTSINTYSRKPVYTMPLAPRAASQVALSEIEATYGRVPRQEPRWLLGA
jgi:hypothetical protein